MGHEVSQFLAFRVRCMVGSSADHMLEASVSKRLVCAYLATTAPAPFFQKATLTAKHPIIPMSKDLFGTPGTHDGWSMELIHDKLGH
jgi:hypothetical protein